MTDSALVSIIIAVGSPIGGLLIAWYGAKFAGKQQRNTEEAKAQRNDAALRAHTRVLCLLEVDQLQGGLAGHLVMKQWENAHRRLEERLMDSNLANAFTPDELLVLLQTVASSGYYLTLLQLQYGRWDEPREQKMSKIAPESRPLADQTTEERNERLSQTYAVVDLMTYPLKEYTKLFREVFADRDVVVMLEGLRENWSRERKISGPRSSWSPLP
jgi:hypothetical protein